MNPETLIDPNHPAVKEFRLSRDRFRYFRTDNLWRAFEEWESKAADHGSGLTVEQLCGALLFYMWLVREEAA